MQRLADESDLRDLIHRYALGLDTRDWDLWRSAFTDEVIIDTSDYEPEPPPRRLPVDIYVSFTSRLFARLRGDAAPDRQPPLRDRRRPRDHHRALPRRALGVGRPRWRSVHDVRHLCRRVRANCGRMAHLVGEAQPAPSGRQPRGDAPRRIGRSPAPIPPGLMTRRTHGPRDRQSAAGGSGLVARGRHGCLELPISAALAPGILSDADHGADRFRHRSRVPDVRPELLRLAKRGTNNNCQPAVRSRCLVPR